MGKKRVAEADLLQNVTAGVAGVDLGSGAKVPPDGVVLDAEPEAAAGTDLTVVTPMNAVMVFSKPENVDKVLEQLRRTALESLGVPDISTKAGREHIASVAYSVSKTKVAIVKEAKALTEGWRESTKKVNAEANRIEENADALRDEIRKPLTEWEDADKNRIAEHEAELVKIQALGDFPPGASAAVIQECIDALELVKPRAWEEFADRAQATTDAVFGRLTRAKRAADEAEKAAAEETARLAREAEEREAQRAEEQRQREEQIAAEATREAERVAEAARVEAEAGAQRDRDAAAERERAERERAERAERLAEDRRIGDHERAIEAIQGMAADAASPMNSVAMIVHISGVFEGMAELKRDFQEFQERADAAIAEGRKRIADRLKLREQAEKECEAQRLRAAEETAQRDRDQAAADERQRIADAAEADAKAAREREADKKHQGAINTAAAVALCKVTKLTADEAKAVIVAIAKGQIPAVKISY